MPAPSTAPRIARGMSRLGFVLSSPSDAAPSKPAKERNPNTDALATADSETPPGMLNASSVSFCPWGEVPPATFTTMTIIRMMISVTEIPSIPSSDRVATRMSPKASTAIKAAATRATTT